MPAEGQQYYSHRENFHNQNFPPSTLWLVQLESNPFHGVEAVGAKVNNCHETHCYQV